MPLGVQVVSPSAGSAPQNLRGNQALAHPRPRGETAFAPYFPRLRISSVLSLSALSLMKPCASFWS